MMLHGSQPPQSPSTSASAGATATATTTAAPTSNTVVNSQYSNATLNNTIPCDQGSGTHHHAGRKRKAETQDNERLSKRLSLLNLEKNGSKLYVPVENPASQASDLVGNCSNGQSYPQPPPRIRVEQYEDTNGNGDMMQVDDSKYKVYIYNIDDELSSSDNDDTNSDAEDGSGKLVFLPDIQKHLKANRIPPHILANSEGQLAGMQVVLYNDPKSLSVPESKDGVRKAIIESRKRLREKQLGDTGPDSDPSSAAMMDSKATLNNGSSYSPPGAILEDSGDVDMDVDMDL